MKGNVITDCTVQFPQCDCLCERCLQQMNIEVTRVCKIAKSGFRKYVYSTGVQLTFCLVGFCASVMNNDTPPVQ